MPLNESAKIGRLILLVYIGVILLMSASVISLHAATKNSERLGAQGTRFVLTAILLLFLYNGSKLAKWITVILFLIGGADAVIAALSTSLVAIPFLDCP